MKVIHRPWQWLVLGLVSLMILTLSFAPIKGSALRSGSSYSRLPDGYGAWYQAMQHQGDICIGRWHESLENLKGTGTILQVYPDLRSAALSYAESQWVNRGNTLILLGVHGSATHAAFATQILSPAGVVTIETRRRMDAKYQDHEIQTLLSDRSGAVIWQWHEGKGTVIAASTPYLGANAYQDQAGNFQFLAKLATPKQGVMWMDESRSGYQNLPESKSPSRITEEQSARSRQCQDLIAQANPNPAPVDPPEVADPILYLLKTPMGLVLLQAFVVLILLIVSKNRRFGALQPLIEPKPDNTMAYIQALATVLQKAKCQSFMTSAIQQSEQRQIQQRLGLGEMLLEPDRVLNTWQQMGYPRPILHQVLKQTPDPQCSEQELLTWLEAWQQVRVELSKPQDLPLR